jgi:SAM-dependent methyltransferase
MPANYARRRDVFRDAGFADPDAILDHLAEEVRALGLSPEALVSATEGVLPWLRRLLSPRLERVPPEQRRLAQLVPEWISDRTGDLMTALWLPRAEHAGGFDVAGYLLGILDGLIAAGRNRDAVCYARFLLDFQFDWGDVYADPGLAYSFMKEREPNPLVWRLLDELGRRGERLRILELGCGIGNDAMAFLSSPLVEAYVGVDVSEQALAQFAERAGRAGARLRPTLLQGDFVDVLASGRPELGCVNLVYSYSSLHYFSSEELREIYGLLHWMLLRLQPAAGYLGFAIKGQGSVWEGQGLPLYRPDVWVNWDGQSRWFPSREALSRQLDAAGFEVRFHELHDHWGYSEVGRRDVFHYVLCSPRPAPQPDQTGPCGGDAR